MNATRREFDLVVFGATGFTGRLVAEYLLRRDESGRDGPRPLRWAVAARNSAKLESVCAELARRCPNADLALVGRIIADSGDPEAMRVMCARTRVVISTVGPYALHGSHLVRACAEGGTDYCDLAGEMQWIHRMIREWDATARQSGARLVHCCGFDSVPFDLGVWFLQREMERLHCGPAQRVFGVVRHMRGAMSGGTIASLLNFVKEAAADPATRRLATDANAFLPEGTRATRERLPDRVAYSEALGTWTGPFVMAAINTKIVRRSNALLGFPWGREFHYEESIATGRGAAGHLRAQGLRAGMGVFIAAAALSPTRALLSRFLPAPGEGPDESARQAGGYRVDFIGLHPANDQPALIATVSGDQDPGYGSTSKMLAESALCLALDNPAAAGGSWTPAACLGEALLTRLEAHAGLSFSVREPGPRD